MRSTFFGLEIAKRSLFAEQTALNTTGHNIANANTTGYSRQAVNRVATPSLEYPNMNKSVAPGQVGTGVEITKIYRVREQFLDSQFRNENKTLGEWTSRADILAKVEAIINEPSDSGIRTVINQLWTSFQDLSKTSTPDAAIAARKIVAQRAVAVAEAFNHQAQQLKELDADITESIQIKVKSVNAKLEEIQSINGRIKELSVLGDVPNDLLDQRDLLVDQISKLVDVKVTDQDNIYSLTIGGNVVIDGANALTLLNETAPVVAGGEIKGLIDARNTDVANYKNQLDLLAQTLATGDVKMKLPNDYTVPNGVSVRGADGTVYNAGIVLPKGTEILVAGLNGLHELGYTMNSPLETGKAFFVGDGTSINAGNIKLNPDMLTNPANIASSMSMYNDGTTDRVVQGDNSLAIMMSAFGSAIITFNDASGVINTTIEGYFRGIVSEIGVKSQTAQSNQDNADVIARQIDGRRMMISGVSLDEEMANMMMFQKAYAAAARALTTMDEALDVVINRMGLVGR
ncbi:flagellar hook-associated protein 1 FlgK [Tumebacillus sp. BK434]|uniref:flagellar hook-associated protein FlgK n=1 Tax=Tumebacillus sp. BK434 TaxID=2512169 RepID=UPI0010E6A10E|nr:flagellar hook-associated protein FlgK [Tumebacillus sp. BK434]TCP57835.1 flagellar hook-associated protein 1 FlgK [Tumebacillus sp. BK434]